MNSSYSKIFGAAVLVISVIINGLVVNYDVAGTDEKFANTAVKTASFSEYSAGSMGVNYAHGITEGSDGSLNFSVNGVSYKNEYERILSEDGFIYGMDWDWFGDWSEGTTSFGNNEITGYPAVYRAEYVERSLYNMKALGYNAVGVWIMNNGGGMTYDENGLVTGLNESFVNNLTLFLESCRRVGIDFVPTLLVHGYASNYNLPSKGLTPQEKYYKYFRYYYDDQARSAYIQNAVNPTCELLSKYQDIIPMVDLTVENGTNAVNDPQNGMLYSNYYGTTWENIASLINTLHDASKTYMPLVPTSVEDIGWPNNSYKYNDLKVDVLGRNEYSTKVADLQSRFINRPSYLGEWNVSEVAGETFTEEYLEKTRKTILSSAIEGGYIGAFYYNWNNEMGGDRTVFTGKNNDDYTSIKRFAITLSYVISDYKNEHKGISAMDKPALLYNNGSDMNYWIAARNVQSYTLQRSTNGGEWQTIAENIDPAMNMLDNGLVYYTDLSAKPGEKYVYRVIAISQNGETSVSESGNQTELFVPVELFCDENGNYAGSFEQNGLYGNKNSANSNGWYDMAWGAKIGQFVKGISRSGDYSLYTNVSEGIGVNEDYSAKWAYNLQLNANTMYKLTYWYKNSSGQISITARPFSSDSNLCYGSVATTEDDDWHSNTLLFTAPSDGKVRIVIMSMKNDNTKFYLDDLSVTEAR